MTATEPFDFMGRHWDYGATTFASITEQIESGVLAERGITNLMIYGPYASTGQWRGLPATGDLMDFDPANGTLDDWRAMVSAANERGITVTIYIALLYLHPSSPIFVQAERDRAAGVESWQSRLFLWDEREPNGAAPPSEPPPESQIERPSEGDWAFSEVAQRWYATSWGLPALNYASDATMDFAQKVLRFWMDNGVQGFELDAPQTMWGFHTGGAGGEGELRHAELVGYPHGIGRSGRCTRTRRAWASTQRRPPSIASGTPTSCSTPTPTTTRSRSPRHGNRRSSRSMRSMRIT